MRPPFDQTGREWRARDCRHKFSLLSRDCIEFLRAVGASLRFENADAKRYAMDSESYVRALQERAAAGTLAGDWLAVTTGR
jgi:hypothetical protein